MISSTLFPDDPAFTRLLGLEQPSILDSDDGLIGKGLNKSNLS